jgi:hypothetical protein
MSMDKKEHLRKFEAIHLLYNEEIDKDLKELESTEDVVKKY